MKQVKIFSDIDFFVLENKINEWMAKVNPSILYVKQSQSGSDTKYITVTIFYEKYSL